MLKIIKSLVVLFVVYFLIACTGSGGSGNEQSSDTPPVNSSVTITSSLTNNSVVAGQSFTITATLTQGIYSIVSFTNDENTPKSITYSRRVCEVTIANPTCLITVTVGLATPPTTIGNNYFIIVSSTCSSACAQIVKGISFAVTQPKLKISKEPGNQILVSDTTSIGVTIESATIPSGSGDITIFFNSNNTAVESVEQSECSIHFESGAVTGCSIPIIATYTGSATITATANNFIPATSNETEVQPLVAGTTSMNITTTLPAGALVVAGQQFTISVSSINGASDTVVFENVAPTPSSIKYTPPTCYVSPSISCTTIVSVDLGTPSASNLSYASRISFVVGGSSIQPPDFRFGVTNP